MATARVARAAVVAPAALVPCVFTTRVDDVFYMPKLVALWALLIAAVWLVVLGPKRPAPRLVPWVDAAAAAFIGWHVIAWLTSTDRHQSLFGERLQHQGLLTLLLYAAFFVLARYVISDRAALMRLLQAVVLGAAAVSAYAIVQRLGLDPIWDGFLPEGRVFSTIGQANALAAYLVMALPAAVVLAARGANAAARIAYAAAAVAMLAAIALTKSRGGYLAVAVVAAVLIVAMWRERKAALAIVGAGLLVALPIMWPRLQSARQGSADVSIRNHVDTWRVAGQIIGDHPLVGTGPETFPDQFPAYSRQVLSPERVAWFDQFRVESPHNRYLAAATDAGLPAAVAYLVFLAGVGTVLVRAIRRSRDPALVAVAAGLAGHLVTDFFMSAEVAGSWLFWVLAGAGVGTSVTSEWFHGASCAVTEEPTSTLRN